jgi:hypothetical protein
MSFTKEEIKIQEQKIFDQIRKAKCVIALEGLSDDALDGGWNYRDLSAYICQLLRERNNLRRQLEIIRKPLSDGEIENLSKGNRHPSSVQKIKEFVRSIEKAHGIGEEVE